MSTEYQTIQVSFLDFDELEQYEQAIQMYKDSGWKELPEGLLFGQNGSLQFQKPESVTFIRPKNRIHPTIQWELDNPEEHKRILEARRSGMHPAIAGLSDAERSKALSVIKQIDIQEDALNMTMDELETKHGPLLGGKLGKKSMAEGKREN